MNNKKKTIFKFIFFGLILAIIGWFFRSSFGPILKELKKLSPFLLILCCFSDFGYHCMDGLNFTASVRRTHKGFPSRYGIGSSLYGAFYRLVTFGSGSPFASTYYLYTKGVDPSEGIGLIAIQYVIQKITISLYAAVLLIINGAFVRQYYGSYMVYVWAGFAAALTICLFLLLICMSDRFHRVLLNILKHWEKTPSRKEKAEKIKEKLSMLQKETKLLLKDKKLLAAHFGRTILKQSFWYIIPFILLHKQAGFMPCLTAAAFAVALAGVFPTPAGIGSTEVLFTLFFTPLTGAVTAASAMLVYRFCTYIFPFLMGGILAAFLSYENIRSKGNKQKHPEQP